MKAFTQELKKVVAIEDIDDPTGDTDLFVPTGTILEVVSVETEGYAVVTDGKSTFPVQPFEVDEVQE